MNSQRRGRPALHDVVFDKKNSESLRDEFKVSKVCEKTKRNVFIGWSDFIKMLL